jgi:hypothetical protein
VRVAKHDHVRTLARDAELELFLQRVRVHDVMNEKFAPGQRDGFGEPEGGRTVRVADHRRDRRNRFQFNDDGIGPDVARVQDVADAVEKFKGTFGSSQPCVSEMTPIFIKVTGET